MRSRANAADLMLVLSIFLVPVGILAGGDVVKGQHYTFLICAAALMGMLFFRRRPCLYPVRNPWLAGFMVYVSFYQVLIMVLWTLQLVPDIQKALSFGMLLFFAFACVYYKAAAESRIRTELIYDAICISALVQASLAWLQILGPDPVEHTVAMLTVWVKEADLPVGSTGNPNFLAAYLAISIPFFFRWGRRPERGMGWYHGLFIIIPLMLMLRTSAAVVAAAFGAAFFHRSSKYGIFIMSFLIGAAAAFLVFDGVRFWSSGYWIGNDRFGWWTICLSQVMDSPGHFLFGRGPGTIWGGYFPVHNDYVTILHQFGLTALWLLLGFIAFANWKNRILGSVFVAGLVNMLGNYPLHLSPCALNLIIAFGLAERERMTAVIQDRRF